VEARGAYQYITSPRKK